MKIEPEAFVVVTETLEVMGKRIGNQPHGKKETILQGEVMN